MYEPPSVPFVANADADADETDPDATMKEKVEIVEIRRKIGKWSETIFIEKLKNQKSEENFRAINHKRSGLTFLWFLGANEGLGDNYWLAEEKQLRLNHRLGRV